MFEIVQTLMAVLMNAWLIVLLMFGLWFVAHDFDAKSRGNWWALAVSMPPVFWALWLSGHDVFWVLAKVI